ncbi:unnamed protein product [Gadus morhua 'NCC']
MSVDSAASDPEGAKGLLRHPEQGDEAHGDRLTLSLRAGATSLGEIISQSPSLGDDGGPIPGPSLII